MALGRWNGAAIDEFGNTMDGCSVKVERESDLVLVLVYSDRAGAVSLGNPFIAADGGNIGFHVAGGAYKITATLGAVSRVWRYVAVGLNQESDVTAGDVVGPASVTDDLPVVFDGTTGKLIKQKTYAAFKTLLVLVKGDVGLGNVDNTTDANKPVSTATQTALDLKASIAYADSLVVGLIDDRGNYDASVNTFPASGGSGTAGAILKGDLWFISVAGTLGGVAVAIGDQVRALVNTPGQTAGNWAVSEGNVGFVPAPIASPTFTGVPEGPTAAPGTNTTQFSTTAFVRAAIDVVLGGVAAGFDTLAEIVAGFIPNSLLTTRGDIITRSATIPQRLALGTAGKQLTSDGADAVWNYMPPWFGGYVAGRYYNGGVAALESNVTTALSANILFATPIIVQEAHTFDRIAFHVQATGTAVNARVGIYNMANGVPTTLVLDAGTVAVGTTGLKTVTISQALPRGTYMLGIVLDGTATMYGTNGVQSATAVEMVGSAGIGGVTGSVMLSVAHAYAALPTPFGTPTYSVSNLISMQLRA